MIRREDLKTMKPETISLLYRNGDLDHLLSETEVAREARLLSEAEGEAGASDPSNIDQGNRGTPPRSGRRSLSRMTPQEIVEARRRGDLDALMRGEVG